MTLKPPKTMRDVYDAEEVIETDPEIQAEAKALAARVAARMKERDKK